MKNRPKHKNLTLSMTEMRSRSNETCKTDMYINKYFHAPNLVELLHKVKTKTLKFNFDHRTMKTRSRSDDKCQLDMYTLQSFHTPNIVDPIAYSIGNTTKTQKLY